MKLSPDYFHTAAKLFSPQIEIVDIPFGDARLPGYFLTAGQSKRPTLIVLNGGDSTNEEMVHWLGFAAVHVVGTALRSRVRGSGAPFN